MRDRVLKTPVLAPLALWAAIGVETLPGTAWAHVRPRTEAPRPNARMDSLPASGAPAFL